MKISSLKQVSFRRAILPASIIAIMAMSGSASAFKIDSDNEDIDMRWDNTFRYTGGWRMQDPAGYQKNSVFVGASESKYKSGDMVTNRLDILSEFDFIYKKDTGFRVSAAGWYDTVYNGRAPQGGPNVGVTTGQLFFPNGIYPDEVNRYYNGPSGEFLDAFVFTKFDLGNVPVNIKVGQHTIYWGETLFSVAHGVSAGQAPVDIRKAVLTPGIEAKEVFLPLNQISFSAQISPEFTIMGQYFLDWKPDRLMLGGTFTSFADPFSYNATTGNPAIFAFSGTDVRHPKDRSGDWGLAARWRPEWLDGTAGFYYREYSPKAYGATANLSTGYLSWNYDQAAPRTKLYGVSLAKQVFGISWGVDADYRKDHAQGAGLGSPVATAGASNWQVLEDVWAGTFTMIAYDGKRDLFSVPLYDSAVLTAEFDYDALEKVTRNKQNFNGPGGNAGCVGAAGAARGGCITNDYWGISFIFEPKWFQVFPGTDLTMPIQFSQGLHGNSALAYGGNEGVGSFSVGLTADVDAKYNVGLKYVGYHGKHNNGVGANSALGDFSHKGWLALTAKATW